MVKLDTRPLAHLRSATIQMRAIILMLAATACGEPTPQTGETTYVDGDAFRLTIEPIAPSGQEAMFDEIDAMQLVVTQANGDVSTHVLGRSSTASPTNESVPPLDEATLMLLGRSGSAVVFHGRTAPLSITEGEHDLSIFVARNGEAVLLDELPSARAMSPMVAAGDGRFFLFGGSDNGARENQSYTSIIQFDLSASSVDRGPNAIDAVLPTPEFGGGWMGHTATLIEGQSSHSGDILITGGTSYMLSGTGGDILGPRYASAAAHRFDPDSEELTAIDGLNHARFAHSAVSNHRGEIAVIGGFRQSESGIEMAEFIEIYDPDSDSWSTRTDPLTAGTVFHGAARLGNQGILVCGGVNAQLEYTATCQLVTPNGVVESAADLPAPLVWPHMVTLPSGAVLLTGGLNAEANEFDTFWSPTLDAQSNAWIYEAGAWRETSPMRNARAMHSATVLPGGRVLIAGGVSGIDAPMEPTGIEYSGLLFDHTHALACAEIFDPESESFRSVDPCGTGTASATLPERTLLPAMASDADYGALIAGGIGVDAGNSVSGVVLFHPTYSGSE